MSERRGTGLSPGLGRGLLVAGVAFGVLFVWSAVSAPDLAWLGSGDAPWIVASDTARTTSRPVRPVRIVFRREFESDAARELHVSRRCLGECAVAVDGAALAGDRGTLARGRHQLTVEAVRSSGPPVVSIALHDASDGSTVVASDAAWTAAAPGARPRAVRLAGRSVRAPSPALPDVPLGALAALALLAVGMAVAGEQFGERSIRALPFLVALGWGALFLRNGISLPDFVGFDVEHHRFYLDYWLESGRIPSPRDGVQTYQPPLFYLLAAAWGSFFSDPTAAATLRSLTFLLGLAQLWALYGCARLLLPGRTAGPAFAALFAAAAPVHLALFHAFSNEALVATLSSYAVWGLLRVLAKPAPGALDGAAIGVLVGAALLAKLSALVLVPVALGALVLRRPRAAAAPAALAALVAVAGPYYGWIASEFGTPFVGNWDERVGFEWWQDPGFRTLESYWQFGGAFGSPWYAGFDSVWDGVYSTFFADGLASGEPSRLLGPPWNHGLARAAVWLSLAPAALVVAGLGVGARRLWHRPDATGLALAGLLVAMASAFVFMTLRVPSYAQAKAIYWSPAFVPLFVAFALGVEWARGRSLWRSRVVSLVLVVWAVVSYASFWIVPDAPETLRSRAERALAQGRTGLAQQHLAAAASDPIPTWVQVGTCRVHLLEGRNELAGVACAAALAHAPRDPDVLFHAANVARRSGDSVSALALLERMREAAPEDARLPPALLAAARRAGRDDRVREAAESWLRSDPGNPTALRVLDAGGGGLPVGEVLEGGQAGRDWPGGGAQRGQADQTPPDPSLAR